MYTEKQIKGYAKALRKALSTRNLDLSHAQSLELLAETLGEKSWNHLSAKIDSFAPTISQRQVIPDGWVLDGKYSNEYAIAIENIDSLGPVLRIEGAPAKSKAFATVMQSVAAEEYVGSHVRFTAEIKTKQVDYASLWIRVDGTGRHMLSFDNMIDTWPFRALRGDNEWQKIELVLDVPLEAHTVNFGCLLIGDGCAQFRSIDFQKVSSEIPISSDRDKRPAAPRNLGLS